MTRARRVKMARRPDVAYCKKNFPTSAVTSADFLFGQPRRSRPSAAYVAARSLCSRGRTQLVLSWPGNIATYQRVDGLWASFQKGGPGDLLGGHALGEKKIDCLDFAFPAIRKYPKVAVFDCPMEDVENIINTEKPWISFKKCLEIPELEVREGDRRYWSKS